MSQQQHDESRHSGNEQEQYQPERKRRPHSYLLNERKKHRNSASLEEENSTLSEQSTQNVSSNGAPCQMDGNYFPTNKNFFVELYILL